MDNLFRDIIPDHKGTLVIFLIFYKRISDISEFKSDYNLPLQARVSSLRNSIAHNLSVSTFDNFDFGIQYLANEFAQISDFFYEQFASLRSLDEKVVFEALSVLNSFETSKLEDRKFGRIFEYLIHKSFTVNKDGSYFTPQPVAELFSNLVNTDTVTEIYDPCAGLGGLLTEINKQLNQKHVHYFASEINSRIASLGTLNLILNGVRNFKYRNADSLRNPFDKNFDLIVSDLPLISKFNENIDFPLFITLAFQYPPKTLVPQH
ncbi:MAG: SAM-dependent DNA methyltransferase [Bacteroidales bacterium]|nr:SAM-dependent DNA methyltransferase [Bacteroidales bacterium]